MLILIASWIIFGGIVGLVARAIFPGRQSMGLVATVGVGIAGAFIGGIVANALFGGGIFAMHATGWVGSIVGSLVLLAALGAATSSRSTSAS